MLCEDQVAVLCSPYPLQQLVQSCSESQHQSPSEQGQQPLHDVVLRESGQKYDTSTSLDEWRLLLLSQTVILLDCTTPHLAKGMGEGELLEANPSMSYTSKDVHPKLAHPGTRLLVPVDIPGRSYPQGPRISRTGDGNPGRDFFI